MNKKVIIIATISLIASFIAIGVIFYMQSFKTVYFDMKQSDIGETTIYNRDDQEVTRITTSGNVRLQPGDYTVVTSGDKYDNSPTRFSLKDGDMSVVIDPPYSSVYRDKILTKELPAINKAITNAYPLVVSNFTLGKGEVYKDGIWYATTLLQNPPTPTDQGDLYRIILKKEGETWVVKTKPSLVLSAKEYPDIPVEILRDINRKVDI